MLHAGWLHATCYMCNNLASYKNCDSWFLVWKCEDSHCIKRMAYGLYSVMLVKTAHRRFPRESLDSHDLAVGEWVAHNANLDGLKKKQFISTCSTIRPGNSRKTKYHGEAIRKFLSYTSLMLHQLTSTIMSELGTWV